MKGCCTIDLVLVAGKAEIFRNEGHRTTSSVRKQDPSIIVLPWIARVTKYMLQVSGTSNISCHIGTPNTKIVRFKIYIKTCFNL